MTAKTVLIAHFASFDLYHPAMPLQFITPIIIHAPEIKLNHKRKVTPNVIVIFKEKNLPLQCIVALPFCGVYTFYIPYSGDIVYR